MQLGYNIIVGYYSILNNVMPSKPSADKSDIN